MQTIYLLSVSRSAPRDAIVPAAAISGGLEHSLAAVVNIELLIEVFLVCFHRPGRDEQIGGDLFGLLPLRQQFQDIELPVGQGFCG